MRAIWPFRHFGLKLLSVGLALMLWFVVSGEETVERTLRIPLELQQFPSGLELSGEPPSTVDVRVRGASSTLARLGPSDLVAELDLRSARAGRRVFRVTPDEVRAPFGVQVVQVNPPTVAMAFEPSTNRRVPIVPSVDGKPAPGFVVGHIAVDPSMVEVVGPESAVKRVTDAFTEPVSVAGAHDTVKETVTVGLLDSSLRLNGQRSAVVTVQVTPAPIERTMREVAVHLRQLRTNLTARATPSTVTVTLRGTREAFARLDSEGLDVYVDMSGLGGGTYTLPLRAEAGEAGVVKIDPPTVEVRVASGQD